VEVELRTMNPTVELVLKHKKANMRKSEFLMLEALKSAPHLNDIGVRRETIFWYVVDMPILKTCMEGERRRGSAPRQWWWEQKMCLDDEDADGAGE
jgi:hypothetical protein